MNRVKSIYLASNKNNSFKTTAATTLINRNNIYSSGQINYNNNVIFNKSITRINESSSSSLVNNNNGSIREFGFLTNIISNFRNLFTTDPEYEKMVEDFDKTFLNSRMKKKKEREEAEKKAMEEKMEAYSKSAEQRAKEEENLTEEQIHEKRKEEQRLYEELIKEKEKAQGFKPPSHKMAPKGDEIVKDTEHSLYLKKEFERAKGVRPLPFDLDRQEPDFNECQDFIGAAIHKPYMPKPSDADRYYQDSAPFTLQDQFDMTLDSFNEARDQLRQVESDARSLGVKFEPIDWDNFFFSEKEFDALPKEYLEFLDRKCEMEFADQIKEMRQRKEAELEKSDDINLDLNENQGRKLSDPDNPLLYPVVVPEYHARYSNVDDADIDPSILNPIGGDGSNASADAAAAASKKATKKNKSPYPWYLDLDYHIPRLIATLFNRDGIVDNIKPRLWYLRKRLFNAGTVLNTLTNQYWDDLAPAYSQKQMLRDAYHHFFPNFFYHFFQGNLRELEQYTTERGHRSISRKIAQIEGEHKILCGDVVKIAKLQKLKYIADPNEGISAKFSLVVFHTMGYRDYSGKIIEMPEEKENALYRTAFKVYLNPTPTKNRFGWSVRRIKPGHSYEFNFEKKKKANQKMIEEEKDNEDEDEDDEKDDEKDNVKDSKKEKDLNNNSNNNNNNSKNNNNDNSKKKKMDEKSK